MERFRYMLRKIKKLASQFLRFFTPIATLYRFGYDQKTKIFKYIFGILFLMCAGCTKEIQYHGYNLDESSIKKIIPNESHLEHVIANFGTPTTAALYGEPKFFYINHKYQRRLFFNPKLIDQDILEISFTQNGIVNLIKRYNFSNIKSFDFNKDRTYLPGNEIGILKQAIGNIGRYNNTDGMRKAGT